MNWFLVLTVFLSFNSYAIDCMELKRQVTPPSSVKVYQKKLKECAMTYNVNPNLLGESVSNWGVGLEEVLVKDCKENFSSINYPDSLLSEILKYSPARFFKEEIDYLVNSPDKKFEGWADLMRIEAIANISNASCENTGKPIDFSRLKNCLRFSKGLANFECSERQKKEFSEEELQDYYELSKKLLSLNRIKQKLIATKRIVESAIDTTLQRASFVVCGEQRIERSEDRVYEAYKSDFGSVTDRAKRIRELRMGFALDDFQKQMNAREIQALEFMDQYEAQLAQDREDQTSKDPKVLRQLQDHRNRLKEVNEEIATINEKLLLASSAYPLLFSGLDENKKFVDQDLSDIFPLRQMKDVKTTNGVEELLNQSKQKIQDNSISVVDKLCDSREVGVEHLLGMSEIRVQMSNHFASFEAASKCIEDKVGQTKLLTTSATVLGCTIGAVVPMTSLYATAACSGYFVHETYSGYSQAIDSLKFAADCRTLSSGVCSQKDFDKAYGDLKTSYQDFVFSIITDVGLEAVGLGALRGLKSATVTTGKSLRQAADKTREMFKRIQRASAESDVAKRAAKYREIILDKTKTREVVSKAKSGVGKVKRRIKGAVQRARIKPKKPQSTISKTHGSHPRYPEFVRNYGDLSQSVDPRFARAYLEGKVPRADEVLNILKKADPSLARIASDFYLKYADKVDPEILMKFIKESTKKKLSPTQFMQSLTEERMLAIAASKNPKELVDNILKEINDLKSTRIAKDVYLAQYAIGDDVLNPGSFLEVQVELPASGGVRQVFRYDTSITKGFHNYLKQNTFDGDTLSFMKFLDDEKISHALMTPHVSIQRYGETITDRFFGMRRVGKETYSFGDAAELNGNIDRFNDIVGPDSPLRIDSSFYYSAPIKADASTSITIGKTQIQLASQRTIDRMAQGFEWPVGHRDVFQVHDLGVHSSLMLADRRAIAVAQKKAQDVVELRKVIDEMDLPQDVKENMKYIFNSFAGAEFEVIGTFMNGPLGLTPDDFSGLSVLNKSSRKCLADILFSMERFSKRIHGIEVPESVISQLRKRITSFDATPHKFTAEGLREVAEQKLKVIRENF